MEAIPRRQPTQEAAADEVTAVVIGTGFGGSVTACRLAQAGVNTLILERGRRYEPGDFPRFSAAEGDIPDTARWAWRIDQGLWETRDLRGVMTVQAAGYGGGSLIYANVHLRAPADGFGDAGWGGINRQALDPYYDLVAHMLDLELAPSERETAKTRHFDAAAKALGREAFKAPLAVNFGPDRTNRFGRQQQQCSLCGECDVGCQISAKNTLDLTYLAEAEGHSNARVRTLAEVLAVHALPDSPEATGEPARFEVEYWDHLVGIGRRVRARYVFVSAGAVGSTELLLRSARREAGRGLPKLADHPGLGARYFANSDAFGMVYDTRETHAPAEEPGPVITRGLAYRAARERPSPDDLAGPLGEDASLAADVFFVMEDGGYPPSMGWAFRLFRGDGLLATNRLTRAMRPDEVAGQARLGSDWPRWWARMRARAAQAAAKKDDLRAFEEELGRLRAGLSTLMTTAHLPPGMSGRLQSELLSAPLQLERAPRLRALVGGLARYVPADLLGIVETAKAYGGHALMGQIGGVTGPLLDAITEAHIDYYTSCLPRGLRQAVRWGMRLGVRPVRWFLRPGVMAETTVGFMEDTDLPHEGAFLPYAWRIMRRAVFGGPPNERTAMLLVMGRDGAAGRLVLDWPKDRSVDPYLDGVLKVEWEQRANHAVVSAQERLMADVASQFGGELRLNPLWVLKKQPVTVHSQGGCTMGKVVDIYGAVPQYPGLYVLDASIIPSSVGVNPSSTIAAVAERALEHIIRTEFGRQNWQAPEWAAARAAVDEHPERLAALTPLQRASTEGALRASAVGITFEEVLHGTWVSPNAYRQPHTDAVGSPMRFALSVSSADITRLILDPEHPMSVTGHASFAPPGGTLNTPNAPIEWAVSGVFNLYPRGGGGAHASRRKMMLYHLVLSPRDPSEQQWPTYLLEAAKTIQDDPGFDSLSDTTTAFFRLFNKQEVTDAYQQGRVTEAQLRAQPIASSTPLPGEVAGGVLRVHLGDFLTQQLPSFEITPEDALPEVKARAYADFARLFMGGLVDIYLPGAIRRLAPAADRAAGPVNGVPAAVEPGPAAPRRGAAFGVKSDGSDVQGPLLAPYSLEVGE